MKNMPRRITGTTGIVAPYVDKSIEIHKKLKKEAEEKAIKDELMRDAAPDMYEALKNIIELHESEERIIKKCDYLAAVKAINKADGK